MTMMHTPAPWELDAPDDAHVTSEDYHTIRAGCGFLAEAKTQRDAGFRIAGHMTAADARLICAAPDLLDALQEAKHMFAGEYPGHPTTDRIFAAIEKATGAPA